MNQLKVNRQHTIVSLFEQGWSKRRIARELALDRATVRKYLAEVTPKSPTPQTGSAEATEAKSPTYPHTGPVSKLGPASLCDPWREPIAAAFQAGLSVQRIYQDLVVEHQFAGSYHAVRRFVLRHHGGAELPFRRMECEAGQELQVDFGQGADITEAYDWYEDRQAGLGYEFLGEVHAAHRRESAASPDALQSRAPDSYAEVSVQNLFLRRE